MELNYWENRQRYNANKNYREGHGYSIDDDRFSRYFYYLEEFNKMDCNIEILDVCCGPGPLEVYLDNYGFKNVEAVDFSEEGIKIAKAKSSKYNYTIGDAKELNEIYKNKSFDVIFCCQSLEHMPNDVLVLSHMYNLLKDGGLLVISVPFENKKRNASHCNEYSFAKWKELCDKLFSTSPIVLERFGESLLQMLIIVRRSYETV